MFFFDLANLIPVDGTATGLTGTKLMLGILLLFVYGILNNFGIGSFAPTMATIYMLGMNPLIAFPIMMSACSISFVVGSIQFVSQGHYARKPTIIFCIIGSIGVIFAGLVVKTINLDLLKWIMIFVMIFTSISLFLDIRNNEIK